MTKVRILTATQHGDAAYKADDVVELEDAVLAEAISQGWADANPEAVAYAESLQRA